MADDSQNKVPNDAVSLGRDDLAAKVERKLAQARHFFGLHDYRACDDLVLQILEADPHNSSAKALHELSSIKLSRRKLYRKMVDPAQPSHSVPSAQTSMPQATHAQEKPLSESRGKPLTAGGGGSAPVDSMRERTISAMVELLKQKGTPLEDWRRTLAPRSPMEGKPKSEMRQELGSPFPEANSAVTEMPQAEPSSQDTKPATRDSGDFFYEVNKSLLTSSAGEVKPSPTVRPANPLLPEAPDAPPSPGQVTEPEKTLIEKSETTRSSESALPNLSADSKPKVVRLPDVQLFDQVTQGHKSGYKEMVEQKLEQRPEEIKNSEIKTVSIAQIKKYLYQEEYELCSRELERIRILFPKNPEIQAFVENTSKRLAELQRIKAFEQQAKELMVSAVAFYQEGKLEEALIAAREVLRVNPNHAQAKEFVGFVERRHSKEKRKAIVVENVRYCKWCGTTVDAVSQFCYHCGKKLT